MITADLLIQYLQNLKEEHIFQIKLVKLEVYRKFYLIFCYEMLYDAAYIYIPPCYLYIRNLLSFCLHYDNPVISV